MVGALTTKKNQLHIPRRLHPFKRTDFELRKYGQPYSPPCLDAPSRRSFPRSARNPKGPSIAAESGPHNGPTAKQGISKLGKIR
jgi:hypothetical protein